MNAVAFLPMYVRGTRDHAETLWCCLRDSLRNRGIDTPDEAASFEPRLKGWLHPELIIGQTCGLPYITELHDHVELVGTPDDGVDGCAPGLYHSTLVVGADDKRAHLSEFFGATVALNGVAIDSITWRMRRRFDSITQGLKSVGTTEPTPRLPFITAKGTFDTRIYDTIRAAIVMLPDDARGAFGLRDVAPLRKADYDVISANLTDAEAVCSLPKLEEIPAALPVS